MSTASVTMVSSKMTVMSALPVALLMISSVSWLMMSVLVKLKMLFLLMACVNVTRVTCHMMVFVSDV